MTAADSDSSGACVGGSEPPAGSEAPGTDFTVVLQRFDGCRLGFAVGLGAIGGVWVVELGEGVVSLWNKTNPDRAVEIGDALLEINAISQDPEQMVNELRSAQILRLKMRRGGQSLREEEPVSEAVSEGTSNAPKQMITMFAEKEAIEEELRQPKFAMVTLSFLPGPHDDAVWKAAAEWTMHRSFLGQDVSFITAYGFPALSCKEWRETKGHPTLDFDVEEHVEKAGHTWYVVKCRLQASAADESTIWPAVRVEEGEKVEWQAPRRLEHLRFDLHHRLKHYECDKEDTYYRIFGETPFARLGGVPGTTTRLRAWLSALASAISLLRLSPAVVAYTLLFFHAPLPGQFPASKSSEPQCELGDDMVVNC